MDSLPLSRRDFCRGAFAAYSSLVMAGFPARALAIGDRTATNVRVSHDGHHQHAEPCLAVNPRDPRNMLAACMVVPGPLATYASFDGGRTWRSNGPLPVPAATPVGNDVSAGFDGAGRGFVCGLLNAPPSPSGKGAERAVNVWRTDDGGRTFAAPVAVTELGALDRPWLAAERGRPYAVHVVWSEGNTAFLSTDLAYARSTDGGRTFEAPRTIAHAAGGLGTPMVACGPHGGVYVVYAAGSTAEAMPRAMTPTQPRETPTTVTVLCSHDGGQTFGRSVKLGRGTIDIAFPHTYSDSLPAIAADPEGGLVCAVFTVHATPGHADLLLAASHDGGRTWSRAKAVTPRDQVIYFQPQVAIDAAGRIGVMAFAMTDGNVSVVLMFSEPGSPRFGHPITVTHQPFDPGKSGRGRRWWIGDYQALATTPRAFHPLWNDTRTGQLQLFTAAVRIRR
jgi:hypothetical protein